MNQEQIRQVTARDEKWVPAKERVKIGTTNVRLETIVPQKEETFQVMIDVIKNYTCYKAFIISAGVLKIFMQQFWYTIKKVLGTNSYEFLLANKKCFVDAEVFQKFLDICSRVQEVDFAEVPNDETTLSFLIDLGYKGPLHKYPSMSVDHMHPPWRTLAAIINKCLSGKAASNDRLRKSRIVILWEMFYRENVKYPELIWEDFAFQIDYKQLKKGRHENMPYLSRGKGSQGKNIADTTEADVDRSKEYDSKPTRKQTSSRRVIKKKVTITADNNINPEPDISLELGKSISLTEAAKEEASRQVHATHARIVTESVPEPAKRKPSEQIVANTIKALKESKKTNRRQPGTRGSSDGTGVSPGILDESKVIPTTSSEGTEQESEYSEEDDDDENIDWVDNDEKEEKDDDNDDKSIDHKKINDEETDDEFVHSEEKVQDDDEETDDELVHADEQVNDDEDEEMTNAEDADTRNGDEEITDAGKVDAEKTEVEKDDIKKAELPPTSSNLSVSSGFGNQFLKLSSDTSLIGTVKDTTDAKINSLLDVQIQQEIPHIQSPSVLSVPVSVIFEPSVLTPIPETPSVAPPTTLLPPSSVSTISHVLLQTTTPIPTPPITTKASPVTMILDLLHPVIQSDTVLEKDVQELKDLGDALQKVLQKQTKELIQKYPQQVNYKEMIEESVQANIINEVNNQLLKFLPKVVSDFATPVIQCTVKNALEKTPLPVAQSSSQAQSSLKAAESLSEYELKTIFFEKIDKIRSYQTHDKDQALYDALLNSLILDDDIAPGPNQGKKTKRSRTKESEPSKKSSTSKETSKGKSPAKTSKSGKSVTVEEPVFEMATDDIEQTIDDGANDADQPPDDSTQSKDKSLKQDWFKQPPRPPTPNPEWNKCQVVIDQPKQPWFNQMVSVAKDPLTLDELMATPIDFSKYAMNRLKIDNLTQAHLVGPNNPEGDRCPFELTKPLPLKGRLGHLTIVAEYFFNNDLEFMKSLDPENKYTTSITKTKATRYDILGIEDMVPTLWSATKVGYNKDAEKGIKHWGEKRQL
ncbi:hypothetical protein Tco_1081184 [Tanacetum coccineum]|uniref:Uncharacterized protein n=1 Tax=Tanacetum coccineum TaxID=301880 RepID=A0ABQ5HY54_9ASTR